MDQDSLISDESNISESGFPELNDHRATKVIKKTHSDELFLDESEDEEDILQTDNDDALLNFSEVAQDIFGGKGLATNEMQDVTEKLSIHESKSEHEEYTEETKGKTDKQGKKKAGKPLKIKQDNSLIFDEPQPDNEIFSDEMDEILEQKHLDKGNVKTKKANLRKKGNGNKDTDTNVNSDQGLMEMAKVPDNAQKKKGNSNRGKKTVNLDQKEVGTETEVLQVSPAVSPIPESEIVSKRGKRKADIPVEKGGNIATTRTKATKPVNKNIKVDDGTESKSEENILEHWETGNTLGKTETEVLQVSPAVSPIPGSGIASKKGKRKADVLVEKVKEAAKLNVENPDKVIKTSPEVILINKQGKQNIDLNATFVKAEEVVVKLNKNAKEKRSGDDPTKEENPKRGKGTTAVGTKPDTENNSTKATKGKLAKVIDTKEVTVQEVPKRNLRSNRISNVESNNSNPPTGTIVRNTKGAKIDKSKERTEIKAEPKKTKTESNQVDDNSGTKHGKSANPTKAKSNKTDAANSTKSSKTGAKKDPVGDPKDAVKGSQKTQSSNPTKKKTVSKAKQQN